VRACERRAAEKSCGSMAGTSSRRPRNAERFERDEPAHKRAKPLNPRSSDRGRQTIRQHSILQALENARRGLTIAELHQTVTEAGADSCVQRTIYRDMTQLVAAGFPLTEEEGRWSVSREGQASRAWPLRSSEVLALLVAEDLFPPSSTGALGLSLRDLRARLMMKLTPEGRAMVEVLRASYLATPVTSLNTIPSAVLEAIDDACGQEHCLQICYKTPGKAPAERIVEPHLLWVHGNRPYLVAYCRTREEFRKFALQRVETAEVIDEAFERRPEFDPREFTTRGFGVMHGQRHDVAVELSAEVAHLAHERWWHHTQHVIERPDGTAVITMTVAGLPEVAAWVASFGGKARAVAPEELVQAVRELHERGLAAHGGSAT